MFWILTAVLAYAAPMQIEHSARLTDAAGGALTGPQVITTRLFNDDVSGTQLWTNTTPVTLADGYFNILLTDGTPELSTEVFNHVEVWLEIQVGSGNPLGPRTRLSSVPYAMVAEYAATAAHADTAELADTAEHATTADHADTADVAGRVVLDTGDGTGSCADGTFGVDAENQSLRVCSGGSWVTLSTASTEIGTSDNPGQSCQSILDADPSAVDSTYFIDPDGVGSQPAYPVYCDMVGTVGWAMVYLMCQDSPGTIQSIDHNLPVIPTTPGPASIPYSRVSAMNPSVVRFTSDFTGGTGYLFDWSTAVSGVNQMETMLEGMTRNTNSCQAMGQPLPGSSGTSCAMSWQHNNGGSEPHDMPTLGCACSVWSGTGMQWGQIDSLGNYNGVSHITGTSWDHSPQTTSGCIQTYVR